jgi:hypothetical protein
LDEDTGESSLEEASERNGRKDIKEPREGLRRRRNGYQATTGKLELLENQSWIWGISPHPVLSIEEIQAETPLVPRKDFGTSGLGREISSLRV